MHRAYLASSSIKMSFIRLESIKYKRLGKIGCKAVCQRHRKSWHSSYSGSFLTDHMPCFIPKKKHIGMF